MKVKTLCNVPVFAGAFFCRQEKRSTKRLRARPFSFGQGYRLRFVGGVSARVLFTAARQRNKGSLWQNCFSVQPRALCFTQYVWHLHVANAAVRRFCFLRRLRRNCFCAKGAFCRRQPRHKWRPCIYISGAHAYRKGVVSLRAAAVFLRLRIGFFAPSAVCQVKSFSFRTAHAVKRERRFFAGGQGGFCGGAKS